MVTTAEAGNQIAEVMPADGTSVTLLRGSSQLLSQQLIHHLRIGLTFGGFHHLADKESDHGLFAGAILFELFGIRGDDFVDDFFQCGGVGGLLRASFFFVDFEGNLCLRSKLRS